MKGDAGWGGLVRNSLPRCRFTATGFSLRRAPFLPSSVQSGAVSYSFDARRMAPFSAPLGTTVGTAGTPTYPSSVPVARSTAASGGASPVRTGGAGRDSIAGPLVVQFDVCIHPHRQADGRRGASLPSPRTPPRTAAHARPGRDRNTGWPGRSCTVISNGMFRTETGDTAETDMRTVHLPQIRRSRF